MYLVNGGSDTFAMVGALMPPQPLLTISGELQLLLLLLLLPPQASTGSKRNYKPRVLLCLRRTRKACHDGVFSAWVQAMVQGGCPAASEKHSTRMREFKMWST